MNFVETCRTAPDSCHRMNYPSVMSLRLSTRPTMRLILAALIMACACPGISYAIEKIVVLGLFKDKAIITIDGKQRVVRAGQTTPEGVTLVSANSEQAVMEVDGDTATYGLGSHIGSYYPKPAEGPKVQIWPDSTGMYHSVGSINGYPVSFLVDTGATLIAMNRNEARRLGIDYLVEGTAGFASTASGIVNTYQVMLGKVRLGEIELRNVEATVIDGDFPTEVLLGNSFLNRLEMTREGTMLELTKRY